jgi:epoxyqueuosine reductase QueG
MIDNIISEITPVYGFCKFNSVSDKLIDCRAKNKLPDNAKSIIVMLFPYYLGENNYEGSNLSHYAVVRDYHSAINSVAESYISELKQTYPDEQFVFFTDNSPIPEVRAAELAGLGVIGKNGLLINKDYGSWFFISEIVTTLDLPTTEFHKTGCLNCGKCIAACPTHALTDSGFKKDLCLSEITQRKGELSDEQKALIKASGCVWGCDICQKVCPLNKNVKIAPSPIFRNSIELTARTDNISDRAYAWRGKKVIERNLKILE